MYLIHFSLVLNLNFRFNDDIREKEDTRCHARRHALVERIEISPTIVRVRVR